MERIFQFKVFILDIILNIKQNIVMVQFFIIQI